jgi:hypothetical protein
MTARSSMSDIILQLRLMVNDTNSLEFTDDQLQDVLDQRAFISSYEGLNTLETILPGGTVEYKEFQADRQWFETDTILTDSAFNTITPTTADYKLAYFTFATSQVIPLLIYGWYYDLNAAAADVWDLKAAKYASEFDFSVDGGSYSKSQRVTNARNTAKEYRSKSFTASSMTIIERTDVIA